MEFNISKKWLNCIYALLRPKIKCICGFLFYSNTKMPEINHFFAEIFTSGGSYLYKVEITFSIDRFMNYP